MILYCEDPFNKHCHWSGSESELVCTEAEPDDFTHCPNCNGAQFYEEEEDE